MSTSLPPGARFQERRFGDLTVRIDRTLCVGFGDCITEAEELFELDEEGVVVFREVAEVVRERLLEACRSCPVDALVVLGADGEQLVP
jgi:ferredoxin